MRTRRSIPAYLLLLVCFSSSLWAVDPSTHISQYAHTAWRLQDGSFSGAPNAITQTADGYLWVGTQNGLFRFDGVRFVPFVPAAGKPASSAILSLLGDRDGSLWIGTGENLERLKDGVLTNLTDGMGRINAIVKDHKGIVWITRSRVRDPNGPLCQVVDTSLRCKGKADGIARPYGGPLVEDLDGNIWIGNADILTRWRAGSATTLAPPGLKNSPGLSGFQALAVGSDGTIWTGINRTGPGLGLRRLVNGSWKPFVAAGLNGEQIEVSALLVDAQNTLWVGTESHGIYRIHDGKAEHFDSASGLSGDTVVGFYEDHEGNLWIATTEGIDSFRDITVLTFSTREGLSSNEANSVLAAHDGTIWIPNHGSLDYIRGDKLSSIRLGTGQLVTSMFEDHTGQLWVGIDDELCVYEKGRFERIAGAHGSIGAVVAIAEDRDHNIWAETTGKSRKLVRIQDRRVTEELPGPEMPLAAVSLAADPNGGIWLGLFNGGLARYEHDHLEAFPMKETQNSRVHQIVALPDGDILGATPSGLVYWRNGTLKTLTVQSGLPCDNLYSLISDAQNGVWLYAQCGLVHITDSELQKWLENDHTVVEVETFDAFDGTRPSGTPFQPRASRSPDGRLWFANETVVQMVNPNHLRINTVVPPVHIEQLIADHKRYLPSPEIRLPALTRDLEINYTALSFVVPQKVLFRYTLEGTDVGWHEAGTRRQAFYNDLRPGHYRFRVMACNNSGVWNEAGASLEFSILPAFYQRLWFIALCLVVSLALLWGIYQFRVQELHRQFAIGVEARVNERTRIARELHDTLLQNFHGLMFQLQAVLNLMPRKPDEARKSLADAIHETKKALADGRDAIQDLRSEPVAKADLAEMLATMSRELVDSNGHEAPPVFEIVEEGERQTLSSTVGNEIRRIALEVLRNAYQHAHAHRIEAEIRYGADSLRLRIRDDGRGINPTVLKEGGRDGHWGLRGIRERADRIGAHLDVWSEPEKGTEVQVELRAAIAYENLRDSDRAKLARRVRSHAKRS